MNLKILKLLEELEREKNQFWNIPKTTAKFLCILIKLSKAKKALEIGTSNGYSGIWLAEVLSNQDGFLYTVESHKERFKMAEENFKKSGLTNIKQLFGHAPEIFEDLQNDLDFVFLDATKCEMKSYLEALISKVVSGGLILADNVISHHEAMEDYKNFALNNKTLQSVLIPLDNGLMLSYKL